MKYTNQIVNTYIYRINSLDLHIKNIMLNKMYDNFFNMTQFNPRNLIYSISYLN